MKHNLQTKIMKLIYKGCWPNSTIQEEISPVFHIHHPSMPQTRFSVIVEAWRGNNSFLAVADKTTGDDWVTLMFWDQTSPTRATPTTLPIPIH